MAASSGIFFCLILLRLVTFLHLGPVQFSTPLRSSRWNPTHPATCRVPSAGHSPPRHLGCPSTAFPCFDFSVCETGVSIGPSFFTTPGTQVGPDILPALPPLSLHNSLGSPRMVLGIQNQLFLPGTTLPGFCALVFRVPGWDSAMGRMGNHYLAQDWACD